jgi:hypothetical protein
MQLSVTWCAVFVPIARPITRNTVAVGSGQAVLQVFCAPAVAAGKDGLDALIRRELPSLRSPRCSQCKAVNILKFCGLTGSVD